MRFSGLMLAKSVSTRLPNKNILDFYGKPMFAVNLEKMLHVLDEVYVSSDSEQILKMAEKYGAKGIIRTEELCGNTPNIPVYQDALKYMDNPDSIIAVHACSPTLNEKLIFTAKGLLELGYGEVMTCHPIMRDGGYHGQHWNIYGSIWALSRERLQNYDDPYKPNPEVLLVDESIDINFPEDYELAQKQWLLTQALSSEITTTKDFSAELSVPVSSSLLPPIDLK